MEGYNKNQYQLY